MKENKKTVKVNFQNPEGTMKLTIKGKKAVDTSLKIMKAFDSACDEIRKKESEK